MTLMFSLPQLWLAPSERQTGIAVVGRILDWYKKSTGKDYMRLKPRVLSVQEIYAYYKESGHSTEVMGASFRARRNSRTGRLRSSDHQPAVARRI